MDSGNSFQSVEYVDQGNNLPRASTTTGYGYKRSPISPVAATRVDMQPLNPRAITAPPPGRSFQAAESYARSRDQLVTSGDNMRITPHILIQMLADKGLGSPRMYRFPPLPAEHVIDKHYASKVKIPYYMEKLKGKSRMDADLANAKATAFCEQQREAAYTQLRTSSAIFRFNRHQHDLAPQIFDTQSDLNSNTVSDKARKEEKEDTERQKLLFRVDSWISDCHKAKARGFSFGALEPVVKGSNDGPVPIVAS